MCGWGVGETGIVLEFKLFVEWGENGETLGSGRPPLLASERDPRYQVWPVLVHPLPWIAQ